MNDTLQVTTPTDREIQMTREFDAPREMVFAAYTKPEMISRWLLGPEGYSMPVCEMDLKPGGKIRWGWRGSDGHEMGLSGTYKEIVPPERTVHTELFDDDWTNGETTVTTTFDERDGVTTLTVTILYVSKEARDGALKSGMSEGVTVSYDRLAKLLTEV